MLSNEDNDLLTRTCGDAPMGRMMRKFWWIPVAISDTLEPDGTPQRVQLFGERYVVFRATNGKVGVFDELCPHRGASLALARNEENSLTCIYHGWKFHVDGKTVAVPTQPKNEADFCKRVPLRHFPVREEAGIVWTWLGEEGTPPEFHKFECMGLPKDQVVITKQRVNANWLQGVETTMDSAHLGVLHQTSVRALGGDIVKSASNKAPVYHVETKPYGFRYASVRDLPDQNAYVRTNSFVMPWFGIVAAPTNEEVGGNVFFSIPIDDENIYYWNILYSMEGPISWQPHMNFTDPNDWPPRPPKGPDENWGQDRALMKRGHFTGFPQHIFTEDFAVIESMGPIQNRVREFLSSGDGAIVQVRRCLFAAVKEFMDGKTPSLANHAAIPYEKIKPISSSYPVGDEGWRQTL